MKKLLLTLVGIIAVSALSAQGFSDGKFGVRVGMNVANGTMKWGGYKISPDTKLGFHVGASYELPITAKFPLLIETGLYVSLKGWSMSDADYGDYEDYEEGESLITTRTNLFYLQLPIVVGYRFALTEKIGLKPFAGLYVGCGIAGKEKAGDFSYDVFKPDEDGYQYMKRFDFGLRFGVYADILTKYYVGLGYELGLMNQGKAGVGKLKNKCFTITVGYNF